MIKNIISKVAVSAAVMAVAAVAFVSVPLSALAYGGHGGGNNGGGYGYNSYPPAPTFANNGAVQVVYPNGFYSTYFVPTATYYAPTRSNYGQAVPFQYNYGTVPTNYPSAYANYANYNYGYGYGHNW
jgi:hypothetical protein